MKKGTVYIADDHPGIIEGFIALLNTENYKVVGSCSTGEQLIAWLAKNTVDIVILDIKMPSLGGLEVLNHYKNKTEKINFIIVSSFLEPHIIEKCLELGAFAYISKAKAAINIISSIETVLQGDIYLSPDVSEVLTTHKKEAALKLTEDQLIKRKKSVENLLSEKEIQVFEHFLEDYSSDEIANELMIKRTTVETHKQRVKRKLNAKTLIGAITKYFKATRLIN